MVHMPTFLTGFLHVTSTTSSATSSITSAPGDIPMIVTARNEGCFEGRCDSTREATIPQFCFHDCDWMYPFGHRSEDVKRAEATPMPTTLVTITTPAETAASATAEPIPSPMNEKLRIPIPRLKITLPVPHVVWETMLPTPHWTR